MNELTRPRWWTLEQRKLLEALRADKVEWPEIARQCGHTIGSCRTTLGKIAARREAQAAPESSKKPYRPWSETDVDELVRLREVEQLKFREIDKRMQRSQGASSVKYESLRRPTGRVHPAEAGGRIHLSEQQLADLVARKQAENRQSPVSRLLGEPPPGYSALDRSKQDGATR